MSGRAKTKHKRALGEKEYSGEQIIKEHNKQGRRGRILIALEGYNYE